MRIIDKGSQALTNVEVLAHISSLEEKYESNGRTETIPEDVRKVMRNVRMNLSLSTQPTNRANFTPETINELTIALKAKPYKLLAAEILQILNHVPRNTTELSMLLEEAEERFPEEKLEAIVGIIDKILAKS